MAYVWCPSPEGKHKGGSVVYWKLTVSSYIYWCVAFFMHLILCIGSLLNMFRDGLFKSIHAIKLVIFVNVAS